jgi:hypothetical protein
MAKAVDDGCGRVAVLGRVGGDNLQSDVLAVSLLVVVSHKPHSPIAAETQFLEDGEAATEAVTEAVTELDWTKASLVVFLGFFVIKFVEHDDAWGLNSPESNVQWLQSNAGWVPISLNNDSGRRVGVHAYWR